MINYLKSEIYRVIRMKSVYVLTLFVLAVLLFMLGITWLTALGDPNYLYNNTQFIYKFSRASLSLLILIVPVLVNLIFADEYKNGTFKNSLSNGVSRITLYFGKLMLLMGVSITISIIVLLVYIPSVELLMENSGSSYRHDFLKTIIYYIPLILASLTLSHMLSFITKKTSHHFTGYYLIVVALPQALFFLRQLSITIPEWIFRLMPYHSMSYGILEWPLFWGIFLLYFGVSTLIGLNIFSKLDV